MTGPNPHLHFWSAWPDGSYRGCLIRAVGIDEVVEWQGRRWQPIPRFDEENRLVPTRDHVNGVVAVPVVEPPAPVDELRRERELAGSAS